MPLITSYLKNMNLQFHYNLNLWTASYDRKKGSLNKGDYVYMRDLLETVLVPLQESNLDRDEEIKKLKILVIRLDHHIDRSRA